MASVEEYTKLTECPVCLTPMKDRTPRALPCLHTFCETCIEQCTGNGNSLSCPTCRKHIVLPKEGVSALPINFFVNNMAETKFDDVSCDACRLADQSAKQIVSFCHTCSFRLCELCTNRHLAIPSFAGHKVQERDLQDKSSKVQVTCRMHGDIISTYCKMCHLFACDKCALAKCHVGHETELQDCRNAFLSMKESLYPEVCLLVKTAEEQLRNMSIKLDKLDHVELKIQREGIKKKQLLDSKVEELLSVVKSNRDELSRQVEVVTKVKSEAEDFSTAFEETFPSTRMNLNLIENAEKNMGSLKQRCREDAAGDRVEITFKESGSDIHFGQLTIDSPVSATPSTDAERITSDDAEGTHGLSLPCNLCGDPLKEPWYRCGMCSNLNLCSKCEDKDGNYLSYFPDHDNNDHLMMIIWQRPSLIKVRDIPYISRQRLSYRQDTRMALGFYCDMCEEYLSSDDTCSFRCGNCDDFDLCQICHRSSRESEEIHDLDHIFIKMKQTDYGRLIPPFLPLLKR